MRWLSNENIRYFDIVTGILEGNRRIPTLIGPKNFPIETTVR